MTVNVYGQRICDKNCPAYEYTEGWGDFCNAGLDFTGRIEDVDGREVWGQLCKLTGKFRVVCDEVG